MGKTKVILDTNCFISALGWNGNERKLLRLLLTEYYILYVSEKQLSELKRVLNYPKLGFSEEQKERFIALIKEKALIINTKTNISILKDKEDNMLLECAQETSADYIITGDKEVLELKHFNNTIILTTKEFLENYENVQ